MFHTIPPTPLLPPPPEEAGVLPRDTNVRGGGRDVEVWGVTGDPRASNPPQAVGGVKEDEMAGEFSQAAREGLARENIHPVVVVVVVVVDGDWERSVGVAVVEAQGVPRMESVGVLSVVGRQANRSSVRVMDSKGPTSRG